MSDLERFMCKTERDPVTGCLIWTKSTDSSGYGTFRAEGRTWGSHRWIFREMHDYLPEVVMHRCDTPACVDWEKCLKPGTHAENQADAVRKGRVRHPVGNEHGRRKVTDRQCEEIRTEYAKGVLTYKMLGDVYGVSAVQVGNIIRGKRKVTSCE